MSSNTFVFAAAAIAGLGAVTLFSAPASAQYYGGGYCAYHPHDPVCLAGVVAPYVHHYHHEHDDHYHDDHYHDHHHHDHDHHDHDHDHDHDHHH